MQTREQLIPTLQATYRTLATQEEWYGKYLAKKAEVQDQEKMIAACKDSKGLKILLGYLSCMAAGIGVQVLGKIFTGSIFIAILIMLALVGTVVLYQLGKKIILTPFNNNRAKPLEAKLALLQQELQKSQQDLNAALAVHEEGSITPTLPSKYYSTQVVGFLLDSVQGFRADTLKEAINLYEEHEHRMRMEANQQYMIEQQEAQAAELQRLSGEVAHAQSMASAAYFNTYGRR